MATPAAELPGEAEGPRGRLDWPDPEDRAQSASDRGRLRCG